MTQTPLSPHFTLEEMTFSPTAERMGFDQTPTPEIIANLTALCENVLEPIRTGLNKPVKIQSGYRCIALNVQIGGATVSQHVVGMAADINVGYGSDAIPVQELFEWCVANLKFDQCIQEFVNADGKGGWVHISWYANGDQRNQALIATKVNGKTIYNPYTPNAFVA